jgi:hypothetical protein
LDTFTAKLPDCVLMWHRDANGEYRGFQSLARDGVRITAQTDVGSTAPDRDGD